MSKQGLYCCFLLTFLLPSSLNGWASSPCEKNISVLYGPYITENVINLRLRPVHNEIERLTGCKIEHHISANYVLFHKKIVRKDFDIILVASAHLPYIKPLQYKRAASGLGPIKVTIFGKKDKGIFNLEDLISKRILLNGDTSIAGLAWEDITENRIDAAQVQMLYSVNTDSLLLNLFKGKAEAAITFNQFYERLPNPLKSKLSILEDRTIALPASIMVKVSLNQAVQNSIASAFINDQHWTAQAPHSELTITPSTHKKLKAIYSPIKY